MTEEKFTRCPSCRTVFRVMPQQLEMRGGQVRCGHCRSVFDGVAQLVSLAPHPEADADLDQVDETAIAAPTVTPQSEQALEPSPNAAGAATEAAEPSQAVAAEAQPTPAPRVRDRRRWAPVAYAVAIPLLVLLLVGQAAFHFRETLVARFPALRPAAKEVCATLGCTVGAPQEIGDLAIQASDLQADPAHQGLLILTATLRNRGSLPLAYPYLELSLTDAQDQVVVRRAFAPGEYAGGTADLARGIPANSEIAVKLFLDASATTQAGYRLYLFYG